MISELGGQRQAQRAGPDILTDTTFEVGLGARCGEDMEPLDVAGELRTGRNLLRNRPRFRSGTLRVGYSLFMILLRAENS